MTASRRITCPRQRQHGVVLMIALIMLIALTLSGIVLFRQVSTGVLIAGNLTFRNAALIASDRGVEVARNWLVTSGANLEQASLANGYYPGWCYDAVDASNMPNPVSGNPGDCKASPPPADFNPFSYNWANSVLATPTDTNGDGIGDDGNGNTVRYVIHRLCRIPGSLSFTSAAGVPQECVTYGSSTSGGTKGAVSYGGGALTNTMQPYFRITTQTTGPKNTVAYSQVILY